MTFEERAEHLQNLKEAAGLDLQNPRDRLLSELVDSISLVCHQVYSIAEVNDGLNESVAALEEQMNLLFEDEEPVDGMGVDDYFEEDEKNPLYQVTCPDCGDSFAVDEDSLLKGFDCPNCGAHLVRA